MNLASKNISNLIFASLVMLAFMFLFTALPFILVFGVIAWAAYKLFRFFGHSRNASRVHSYERERADKIEKEVMDDFSYPESEIIDVDYTEIK